MIATSDTIVVDTAGALGHDVAIGRHLDAERSIRQLRNRAGVDGAAREGFHDHVVHDRAAAFEQERHVDVGRGVVVVREQHVGVEVTLRAFGEQPAPVRRGGRASVAAVAARVPYHRALDGERHPIR